MPLTQKPRLSLNQLSTTEDCKHRIIYIYNENSQMHIHDNFYEVFLVLAPSIVHIVNGVESTLPRGTLVFIRDTDMHLFQYETTKVPSFLNITFSKNVYKKLFSFMANWRLSDELLSSSLPPQVMINEAEISWVLTQIEQINSTEHTNVALTKHYYRKLLFFLFSNHLLRPVLEIQSSNPAPYWLRSLNTTMQDLTHFSQDIDHIVALSGKSREYLGRMLKQYYGKTITEYLNDLRLNYWANMLTNSDASVIDLCYECGFQNVSWAYTLFKNKYGVSPLKYRKISK